MICSRGTVRCLVYPRGMGENASPLVDDVSLLAVLRRLRDLVRAGNHIRSLVLTTLTDWIRRERRVITSDDLNDWGSKSPLSL